MKVSTSTTSPSATFRSAAVSLLDHIGLVLQIMLSVFGRNFSSRPHATCGRSRIGLLSTIASSFVFILLMSVQGEAQVSINSVCVCSNGNLIVDFDNFPTGCVDGYDIGIQFTADDNTVGIATVVDISSEPVVFEAPFTKTVAAMGTISIGNFTANCNPSNVPFLPSPTAFTQEDALSITNVAGSLDQDVDNVAGICSGTVPDLLPSINTTGGCTVSLSQSPAAGESFGAACDDTQVVTVTATDACGASETFMATLTLKDVENPVAITQVPAPTSVDANCSATIMASALDDGSTDNCTLVLGISTTGAAGDGGTFASPTAMVTLAEGTDFDFTMACPSSVDVFLHVIDECDNEVVSPAVAASITDDTNPTAMTQVPAVYTADASCEVVVAAADIDDGSSDNCNFVIGISSTGVAGDGGTFAAPTAMVTLAEGTDFDFAAACPASDDVFLHVIDECGNETISPAVSVSITDGMAPTGDCTALDQAGVNACLADAPDAPTEAEVIALYNDNCGPLSALIQDPPTITGDDCGWTITYEVTVTDGCSNAAPVCTVTYSGSDMTDPAFVAPVENIGATQAIECGDNIDPHSLENAYGRGWPTISDNCLAAAITPAYFDSEITEPWNGTAFTLPNGFTISYSDSEIPHPDGVCSGPTIERKYMVERTWMITDPCDNMVSSDAPRAGTGFDFQRIVVIDNNVPPTARVTANPIDLVLDADCMATLTAAMVEFESFDNCGSDDPLDPSTFDVSTTALIKIAGAAVPYAESIDFNNLNLGASCPTTITIELQVTDECGNLGTTTKDITLTDDSNPTITAPNDIDVEGCNTAEIMNGGLTALAYSETAVIITQVDFEAETGAVVSDNCEVNIEYIDAMAGNCPIVVTRTFTVSDACGNSATDTQTINIDDTTDPVITMCPADVTVSVDANCVVPELESGASSVTVHPMCTVSGLDICGSTFPDGPYSVVSVVFPNEGTYVVTFSNSDATPTLRANYFGSYASLCTGGVQPNLGGTCAVGTSSSTNSNQDYMVNTPVGTGPHTLLFVSEGDFDFVVNAVSPQVPSVNDLPSTVDLANINELCPYTVTFSDDDSGVSACASSMNPRGTIVRTFTVTDACDNTATCSMNITVEDNMAPMITTCPTDDTAVGCGASALPATTMDATGFMSVGGVVEDNCTLAADMTYSYADTPMPTAVCPTTVERVWTVTDACGNPMECTQTYTLMPDLEANVSGTLNVCVDGNTILSGNPTGCDMPYTHAWTITNAGGTGATDATNLTNETTEDVTFNATGLTPGTVTVEYTVTDANGCTATDDAEIFIPVDCDFEFSIDDPCVCNNDSDVNADDGTFMELVTVTGPSGAALPPGQIWTVFNSAGAYEPSPADEENTPGPQGDNFNDLPAAPQFSYCDLPGGCIVYNSPGGIQLIAPTGSYYQTFVHVEFEGYTMSVEGPMAAGMTSNTTLSVQNTCFYPVLQATSQTAACVTDGAFTITASPDASSDPTGVFGFDGDAMFVGGNPPYDYTPQAGLTDNGDGTATFDPAVAGVGCHTVSYTFQDNASLNTSEPGCYQAIEFDITVFPSDDPTFAVTASMCAGLTQPLALTNPLTAWPTCSTPAIADGARVRWYGTGVVDNGTAADATGVFTAPAADGTYTICAEVGAGSCAQNFCQDVIVESAPTAPSHVSVGCATEVGETDLTLATTVPAALLTSITSDYTGGLVNLSGYLTAGTAGGTWTVTNAPNLTGQSAVVSGSSLFYTDPGCYELRYTNDCGMVDLTIAVGEEPAPAFDLPDVVCFDDITAITYNIPGDYMTSPDYTFLSDRAYASSDPTVATVDVAGLVTVVAPGTTTITMTESTELSCGDPTTDGVTVSCNKVAEQILEVIGQPSNLDIVGADFVCTTAADQVGLTVTGNFIPTNPDFISWYGGLSGGSATGAGNVEDTGLTGTFYSMGAQPGTYTVCASLGEPGCTVNICKDITVVDQQVVVLNDQHIECAINPSGLFDLAGMLDANLSSANAYGGVWTLTSGPASAVIAGQTMSYTEPGCYELTYNAPTVDPATGTVVDPAGGDCDAADEVAFIYISEQPQPSFDIQNEVCISAGDPAQTFTPNVSSPSYTATAVGSWAITDNVTNATAAIDATSGMVTLTPTGGDVSGTYTVSYTETITNAACNGVGPQTCDETVDMVVSVQDGTALDPTFTADNLDPCPTGSSLGATTVNLTPTVSGGVFTGVGVTDNGAGTGGTFVAPACGTYAIAYTLTTNGGCSNSYTLSITTDKTAPTVTTSPMEMTVECDGAGNITARDAWVANFGGGVATDNCDGPTWSSQLVNTISGCGGTSEAVYAFTAEDGCGNTVTEFASFIIEDTAIPAIATTADLTLDCDDINSTTDPTAQITQWLENNYTASDVCSGVATVTYDFTPSALDYCSASSTLVTWTATDACGLTNTATSSLIITPDTEVPAISTTADLTLDCDDINGTTSPASLVAQWLENNYTASDNCELMSVTYDFTPAALDYCRASTTVVTWTATDACGLTNTATSNLVITPDTEVPTIVTTADLTLDCDDINDTTDPTAFVTQWLENNYTAGDNCDLESVTYDFTPAALDYCTASTTVVTWTATDACGLTNTATSNLVITPDTEIPTIVTTADLTLDCDDINGTTDPTAFVTQWLENNYTASDNCELMSVTYDFTPAALDYCTADTTVVTWTATDACGLTNTATSDLIIVPDTEVPTITTTADLTLDCDDFGSTSDPVAFVTQWLENNYTASDNCELMSVTYDFTPAALDYCTADTTVVTWTATDACGLTNTATSDLIIVPDTEVPTITTTADLTLDCDDFGSTSDPVAFVTQWLENNYTASDNCELMSVTYDFTPAALDYCTADTTVVTWTATDACGLTNTATSNLIIVPDTEAPTLDQAEPLDDTVQCGDAIPAVPALTFSDNCVTALVVDFSEVTTQSQSTNETTLTRTWVATDDCGQSITVDQVITILDSTGPAIVSCPGDIDVDSDAGVCGAIVTYDLPTFSDNCDPNGMLGTIVTGLNSGAVFPVGATTVTYTFIDGAGNEVATPCSFTVTVTDNEDPEFINCPDPGFTFDVFTNDCNAAANWTVPTATDNCNGVTVTADPANIIAQGDIDVAPGMYTVSYIAEDAAGNQATCTFDVNVIDTEDPVVTCPSQSAITVRGTNDGCTFVMGSAAFDATYDENCSPITSLVHDYVSSSSASDNTLNGHTFLAGNTTVTWTATDASGNTGTCSFVVTVLDDDAPTFACPSDMDVQGCAGVVPDVASTLVGQDNCSSAADITFSQSPVAGTLFGPTPGNVIPVTITATDEADNFSQCTIDITVIDSEMPVFNSCPAQALVFAADVDECSTFVNWSIPVAYDNCDNLLTPVLTSGPAPGTRQDVGMYTVVYTATDADNNTGTCTFDVEVMDTQAPTLAAGIPVDMTFNCDDPTVFIPFVMTSAMLTDNCTDPVTDIQNNYIPGQGADPAMCEFYTFTDLYEWIATDDADNSMRWTQRVSYQDTVAPVLTVPSDITIECGESIDPTNTGIATATDNCADEAFIAINFSDVMTDECGFTGVITRTWTAADPCMNADTSVQIITIEDTTPPDLVCADITIQLDSFGNASITPIELITSVSDICSDADSLTYSLNQTMFTCDDIGDVVVRLDVTDECGNVASCTPTVTVEDPTEMCVTCDVDCDFSCIESMNISVDPTSCTAVILPSMLSNELDEGCNDLFDVVLSLNGTVVSDTLDLTFLNKRIDYTIYNLDPNCANSCAGTFLLEDKGRPTITCVNDTVFCNATDTAMVIRPTVVSGCMGARLELVGQEMETIDCDTMFTGRITRRWRAVGQNGMISNTCEQTVMIRRLQPGVITFPGNRTVGGGNHIACNSGYTEDSNGNPLPSAGSQVGVPMMSGMSIYPLEDGVFCSGYVTYEDRLIGETPGVKKIMRTWTVGEWWCGTTLPISRPQIIEIADIEGPTIEPMPDMTVSTGGFECATLMDLPASVAVDTDLCNEVVRYEVEYGGPVLNTNGGRVMMPVDTNIVTYRAYDAAGNFGETSFKVIVRDLAEPVAICERWTNVPLLTTGESRIPASALDDGSFDECTEVTFQVARMDDGCGMLGGVFQDSVQFCCADAGDTIMVSLRVTDYSGNSNTCMVRVIVDDKVPPVIQCPADMTVDCQFAYDENRLGDFFGDPTIVDNCGDNFTVENRLEGELDRCSEGTLTRYMDIFDGNSLIRTCEQSITFDGVEKLTEDSIVWPIDFTVVNGCDSTALSTDSLPLLAQFPTINRPACSQIGFDFVDLPFTSVGSVPNTDSIACIKIIRRWTVIDWCSRNGVGQYERFTHEQVLKLVNTIDPVFTSPTTPLEVCSFDINCGPAQVELVATATDDCTLPEDLLYTYTIDVGADGDPSNDVLPAGVGNDATANYPEGTHEITFTVLDLCGNQAQQSRVFTVMSCKTPQAICLSGLTSTLIPWDEDGDGVADTKKVRLTPDYFDAGSGGSCDRTAVLAFSNDTTDTERIYECGDVGVNPVQIYVIDDLGNFDFCDTEIRILNTDTMAGLCDTIVNRVAVQGTIATQSGDIISDVKVELQGIELAQTATNDDGYYEFADMPTGGTYSVVPELNTNHDEGVSTLDLVLIQRHILGLKALEGPYTILAGDINADERITGADVVELRKLILGHTMEFTSNTSWRFIDGLFDFTDDTDPWYSFLPEDYFIPTLMSDMEVDFVGLKVGDVNGSVTNLTDGNSLDSRSGAVSLAIDDQMVQEGQVVEMPVYAGTSGVLYGWQYELATDGVTAVAVMPGVAMITPVHRKITDRSLAMSFDVSNGLQVEAGQILYTVTIRAKQDGRLSDMITMTDEGLRSEIYTGAALDVQDAEIEWRGSTSEEGLFSVDQNKPNPWTSHTQIGFFIPNDGDVTVRIKDVTGRQLFTTTAYYTMGSHGVNVAKSDLGSSGVLIYEVEFADHIETRKMILID